MSSEKKDCTRCRKYTECEDKRKTIGFYCSKFKRVKSESTQLVDKMFGNDMETFRTEVTDTLSLDFDKLELDLEKMVTDAIDPHTHMIRDQKIDDRDIPEFPNYFQFMIDKNGMDLGTVFSRQMYVNSMLFGEICPKCSNPKIKDVRDVPIKMKARDLPEHLVFLEHGVCPKCKRNKAQLIKKKRINPYQELAALVGQRAGKSTMLVSPAVCYLLHRMLKLQKPYEVYGLNPTTLVGTLVAQTFNNAVEQLWLPVKTYLEGSPWFTSYHELLADYGNKYGEEFIRFGAQGIHYTHRQIMLYPAGPNRKLLRGKTRWLAAIDEWDFFDAEDDSEQVRMNGTEVYTSLSNSMISVRNGWQEKLEEGYYNLPTAYFLTASSPQHARGVLVKHVSENLNSKQVYALHLPTWEIHPKMTRERLQSFYDKDPQKAERDFGANPPLTDSAFIEDHDAITGMIGRNTPNRVEYEWVHKESKSTNGILRAAKITKRHLPGTIEPAIMALDAGYTNNSFALTVGHRNPNKHAAKKFITDIMVEILPEKGKVSLSHSKIYKEIIKPIIKEFNVSAVVADRWNSIKLLQDIEEDLKITVGQYSIKYKEMHLVRNHVIDGTLEIPYTKKTLDEIIKEEGKYPEQFKYRPVEHFLLQCATVKDDGKEILKGDKLTDDLWRAFALMNTFLMNDEFCRKHLKNRMRRQLDGGLVAASLVSRGNIGVGGHGVLHNPQSLMESVNKVAVASGGLSGGVFNLTPGVFARRQ